MDIRQAMGQRAISSMVGRPEARQDLYKTIQASNTAGSISPDGTIEEIEDLESRDLNPYWDKKNKSKYEISTTLKKNTVKFNPITKKIYTDNGDLIKKLYCPYIMQWGDLTQITQ